MLKYKFGENFKVASFILSSCALFFSILYSPHICFWICMVMLSSLPGRISFCRNILIILSLIMILYSASSRVIGLTTSDDLIYTYMPIVMSQVEKLGIFSTWMGVEFGYGLYFNFIIHFINNITPREVLYFSVLLSLSLYYIWLNFFFLNKIEARHRGLISAISLSFIQIGFLSQFLRQEIATPLLLISIFSFIDNKKIKSLIFLFLATIFHSTSLVIFIFMLVFNKFKPKLLIWVYFLFFLSMLVLVYKPDVIVTIFKIIHLDNIASKLVYYQSGQSVPILNAISSGKFIILLIFIMYFNRSGIFEFTTDKSKYLIRFCFYASIFSLPLLVLPNASRLFLIVPGFLFSYVIYTCLKDRIVILKIIFLLFVTLSIFFPQRLNGGVNEYFHLWSIYSWYSLEYPFYYLGH